MDDAGTYYFEFDWSGRKFTETGSFRFPSELNRIRIT